MQVILKRNWFVGGNRYRSIKKSPIEIPDAYRKLLPKDAVVVEPKIPVEDAPEEDSEVVSGSMFQDTPPAVPVEEAPYVNPAHALDSDRAFAEAFSEVNKEAKSEVDDLRNKFKTPSKGN